MQLLHSTTKSNSPQACAERLLDCLPPVMRFVRKHMRSNRNRHLSVPQFRILALLRSAPAANLSAVAEFLGASLPTTSRIVTCLVNKKLITRRERECDRRQIELQLTAQGAAAMEDARKATQYQLALELQTLSPSQRAALLDAMTSLHALFAPALQCGDAVPARPARQTDPSAPALNRLGSLSRKAVSPRS